MRNIANLSTYFKEIAASNKAAAIKVFKTLLDGIQTSCGIETSQAIAALSNSPIFVVSHAKEEGYYYSISDRMCVAPSKNKSKFKETDEKTDGTDVSTIFSIREGEIDAGWYFIITDDTSKSHQWRNVPVAVGYHNGTSFEGTLITFMPGGTNPHLWNVRTVEPCEGPDGIRDISDAVTYDSKAPNSITIVNKGDNWHDISNAAPAAPAKVPAKVPTKVPAKVPIRAPAAVPIARPTASAAPAADIPSIRKLISALLDGIEFLPEGMASDKLNLVAAEVENLRRAIRRA